MNRTIALITRFRVPQFCFSSDRMKEKERGDEKHFFTKEDQKTMERLLKKMKQETKGATAANDTDKEELLAIFSRYKVTFSDGLVEEILKWKKE